MRRSGPSCGRADDVKSLHLHGTAEGGSDPCGPGRVVGHGAEGGASGHPADGAGSRKLPFAPPDGQPRQAPIPDDPPEPSRRRVVRGRSVEDREDAGDTAGGFQPGGVPNGSFHRTCHAGRAFGRGVAMRRAGQGGFHAIQSCRYQCSFGPDVRVPCNGKADDPLERGGRSRRAAAQPGPKGAGAVARRVCTSAFRSARASSAAAARRAAWASARSPAAWPSPARKRVR